MPKTNDTALEAFIAAKTEIDAVLARLASRSADHFGHSPDEVNWGHVGTLAHYRAPSAKSPTWPSAKASTPPEHPPD